MFGQPSPTPPPRSRPRIPPNGGRNLSYPFDLCCPSGAPPWGSKGIPGVGWHAPQLNCPTPLGWACLPGLLPLCAPCTNNPKTSDAMGHSTQAGVHVSSLYQSRHSFSTPVCRWPSPLDLFRSMTFKPLLLGGAMLFNGMLTAPYGKILIRV